MSASKRYDYLDILKILAMTMVCAYHFSWTGDLGTGVGRLAFGINSACCPLFFMVNGALMLPHHHNSNIIIPKIFRLLAQWYVWRFITVVLVRLFHGADLFPNGMIALFLGEHEEVALNHLWFILTLANIYFLYPLLHREFWAFRTEGPLNSYLCPFTALLFLFYFGPIAANTFFKALPSFQGILPRLATLSDRMSLLGSVGSMLFYFLLGGIMHFYFGKLQKCPLWIPLSGLAIGLITLYGRWLLESSAPGFEWDIVYSAYVSVPCLLISVSLFTLAAKVPWEAVPVQIKKQFYIIGDNTLSVYYMHWIFGCTVLPLIFNVVGHTGLVINFIKAFCMVLLFSYIGYSLKKAPVTGKLF